MTVRGVLSGGNDGLAANQTFVDVGLPAGTVRGEVCVFASAFPGGTANTITDNEWGFTTLSGPDTGATTMRSYLLGDSLLTADIADGTRRTTWSGSSRPTAAGYVLSGVDLAGRVVGAALASGNATTKVAPSVVLPNDGKVYELYLFACVRVAASAALPTLSWPANFTQDDRNAASSTGNVASEVGVARRTATLTGAGQTVSPGTVTLSASAICTVYTLAIPRVPRIYVLDTDGVTRLPATLKGIWNGTTVDPANLR